jgi:hypothetical protein
MERENVLSLETIQTLFTDRCAKRFSVSQTAILPEQSRI